MSMRRSPAAIDAYVAAIVIAGTIVLGLAAWALPSTPHVRDWGVLAALALLASRFPLRIPGRNAWVSISDPFFMTSADRKSTRLNSSHLVISYAVFCLKKKKTTNQ